MPRKLDSRQDELVATGEAIDTADAVIARAEVPGDRLVSLNIEATADASYAVDVAAVEDPDAADWFEGEVTYDQADEADPQDIRDTFILGDRWIRVRVTTGAAGGETADVTLQGA